MTEAKKLFRSRDNRVLAGVCGGLGEYFNVDPVIVRIIFVLLALGHGVGILIYIILALVLPKNPSQRDSGEPVNEKIKEFADDIREKTQEFASEIKHNRGPGDRRSIIGIILVILGLLILTNNLFPMPWFRWSFFWPMILILIGFFLIFKKK